MLTLGILFGVIALVPAGILLFKFFIVDFGRKWNDIRLTDFFPVLILASPEVWLPEHFNKEKRRRILFMGFLFRLFLGLAVVLVVVGFVFQNVQK